MFLGGAVQSILAMAWWLANLVQLSGTSGSAPAWALPPAWSHGGLLLFGFLPWFVFGFLMTAGPRWQNAPVVQRREFVAAAGLMAAGWLLFYLALWIPALAMLGGLFAWGGFTLGALRVMRIAAHPAKDRRHIRAVAVAMAVGIASFGLWAAGTAGAPPEWGHLGVELGLWGFAAPLFVVVGHRMVPFFSSTVVPRYVIYRPYWALWVILASFTLHAVCAALHQEAWAWPGDLGGAAVAAYLWLKWQPRHALAVRLLAVLHIGFAWLWISLLLHGIAGLAAVLGYSILGHAPLHALTVGLFASLVVAMVSRVTLGHSGGPLQADSSTWTIFWVIQAAAVTRVAAEVLPSGLYYPAAMAGAVLWLAGFGWWSVKYAPRYWRPRQDGEAG